MGRPKKTHVLTRRHMSMPEGQVRWKTACGLSVTSGSPDNHGVLLVTDYASCSRCSAVFGAEPKGYVWADLDGELL